MRGSQGWLPRIAMSRPAVAARHQGAPSLDTVRPRCDDAAQEEPPMERRLSRLSRRAFVVGAGAAGLGLLAGCGRPPWQGQPPPPKVPIIGWLSGESAGSADEPGFVAGLEAFRQGLAALGYVEGQNVIL